MTDASNSATAASTSDPQLVVPVTEEKLIDKERNRLNQKIGDLATEYIKLTNRFKRALIEHKLAVDYFEFRSFWFDFLPLTLIATAITVIGFIISGKPPQNDDGAAAENSVEFEPLLTGQSKQMLSVLVGVLGAVSTLFNAIGKRTNYQSQCDMHRAAVKALEKICLTVDFEMDWFNRNGKYVDDIARKIVQYPEQRSENEDVATRLGADLKSHQASFKAMQDACCESPVPTRVIQAFTLLDQIHGNGSCTATDLIFYSHKLWKEFSTYRWWPLKAPRIDVTEKYDEWWEKKNKKANRNDNSKKDGAVKKREPNDDAINETIVAKPRMNSSDETKELKVPLLTTPPSYGALASNV
eukprot:scaffold6019_cov78-Skeletonema_dohrnii-CCMP3373.AAC.3